MSPDAYAQMGIQLAYYLVHRECTATYETGTARCFYHGRTGIFPCLLPTLPI